MPYADSNGVKLYYEEAGRGTPIIFVHEFADDLFSWEPQMRFFSRRYRCIAYNARGYPPSDVPKSASKYSQQIACDDVLNVLRHLKIRKAHVIGCSMGGFATLHFGLNYPRNALSLTSVGVGFGSDPDKKAQFARDNAVMVKRFLELGTKEAIKPYHEENGAYEGVDYVSYDVLGGRYEEADFQAVGSGQQSGDISFPGHCRLKNCFRAATIEAIVRRLVNLTARAYRHAQQLNFPDIVGFQCLIFHGKVKASISNRHWSEVIDIAIFHGRQDGIAEALGIGIMEIVFAVQIVGWARPEAGLRVG